ncbi:MAG: YggT family protein [Chloroflexota bacterium]|jgi:YggT family protein|nr:YggT family protein [Chloroflexota bacterium]
MGGFVGNLLQIAFFAIWALILGRVLLSWFDPAGRTAAGRVVVSATEPLLGPIRRALPPTGAIDMSPLIVLIVLSVLWRAI